jgi:hypothetical protein
MKMIGETSFSRMAQVKKAPRCLKKPTIKLVCKCGAIYFESELAIKHNQAKLKLCKLCRDEKKRNDQIKINEAIVAIARRKGLI